MRRGDFVTIALPGDYGKPRPALIIQDDAFTALDSVTVARLSSDLYAAPLVRIDVAPSAENGLRLPSQIMIDKLVTVPKSRIGERIGQAEPQLVQRVNAALARFLGLPPAQT